MKYLEGLGMNTKISIDNLIDIVAAHGKVKTGVDVYGSNSVLLLAGDVLVEKVRTLEILREAGLSSVSIDTASDGCLLDGHGNLVKINSDELVNIPAFDSQTSDSIFPDIATNEIEMKLVEIEEIKKQAFLKYNEAKKSIKKVIAEIKATGGQFDFDEVEANVSVLIEFLTVGDNPFSYLTQEIFSYDDYLYNHSINVCAIGTAVLNRFNTYFSNTVSDLLRDKRSDLYTPFEKKSELQQNFFYCYYPDELRDISLGFFLHDLGKVMVTDDILNKQSGLTKKEFIEVQKHSYEYGAQILEKNRIKSSAIKNIIYYHHACLYEGEEKCYPLDIKHTQIPLYVRICKLADIYDAMTSKRCYKEAVSPISVVTQLFRTYAKKDKMLQYILHSFVKSIGIYPPGSILFLRNGQMAYVLDSKGPFVVPFTDKQENTLTSKPDPFIISAQESDPARLIDNRKSLKTPKDVYAILPSYIKKIIRNS
jgi:HD-GYP domain-containing protein (c-di-GMP phosphodiesterase class II)